MEQGQQWGYHSMNGIIPPEDWSQYYKECGGKKQSPVALDSTRATTATIEKGIQFQGQCTSLEFSTSETNYKWTPVSGSTASIQLGDASYVLDHLHLHLPSEHEMDGKLLDGEIHFVHRGVKNNQLLVVGIMLNIVDDGPSKWLNHLLPPLRSAEAKTVVLSENLYSSVFERTGGFFFHYSGSLTTPPCSEIVSWWVASNPLEISQEQFDLLQSKLRGMACNKHGENNRPIQPLNGRQVYQFSNFGVDR